MSKFNNNSNFNQIIFNGNLAFVPRMTYYQTKHGKSVSKTYFTVLSDDVYKGYKQTNALQCVAYGKHAQKIAKNFKRGEFVEAKGSTRTFSTKHVQGIYLKYPVTVTRFVIYSLIQITKGVKLTDKPSVNKVTPVKENGKAVKISENDLPF